MARRALLAVGLAMMALSLASAAEPVITVDGSGTSNPGALLWRVIEILRARTIPTPLITYRAVGSGSGASDMIGSSPFTTSRNAFACGDVPVNASGFQTMRDAGNPVVHVPYLVGSVSFFHNIPGVGKGATGLRLSPCTLAKILNSTITAWDDPEIVEQNRDTFQTVTIPPMQKIVLVHRNPGSSSTYGISNYLARACPEQWDPKVTGVTINVWPDDSTGRAITVTNSQEMVDQVSKTEFSLGYVESGQGLAGGLKEVVIKNKAGNWVLSNNATIVSTDILSGAFLPSLSADWSNVSLVWQDGGATWPITLATWFYARADLNFLGNAGGLVKELFKLVLSDEVAALMPGFGFIALPKPLRDSYISQLSGNSLVNSSASAAWQVEGKDTSNAFGMDPYVVSTKRQSYVYNTLVQVSSDLSAATKTLQLGNAYQVHGSGSFEAATFLRRCMANLQGMSRVPIDMTYRVVGTLEAQSELLQYSDMLSGYNHFKVGDMPLTYQQYSSLTSAAAASAIGGIYQLPFAMGSLSVFHSMQVPATSYSVKLDACTLAQIYMGKITQWNDPAILALNPAWPASSALLDKPIIVFTYAVSSSMAATFIQFLSSKAGCEGGEDGGFAAANAGSTTLLTANQYASTQYMGKSIVSPNDMVAALAATPHAIGYVQSGLGLAAGLDEVAVKNVAGNFVTSTSGDVQQAVLAAYGSSSVPPSFANDLSGLGLTNREGEDTFPMAHLLYLYVYSDLNGYGYAGPLTTALIQYVLGPSGQALVSSSGLLPLPASMLAQAQGQVGLIKVRAQTEDWRFEEQDQYSAVGSLLYTFSANRQTYEQQQLADLAAGMAQLQAQAGSNMPVVVRVAGRSDSSNVTRRALDMLQGYALGPLAASLEVVPDQTPLAPLLQRPSSPRAHLLVSDRPLSSKEWTDLGAAGVQPLQIPFMLRPVSLLYRGGPAGVRLSACTLAAILRGDATTWTDPRIVQDNPGLSLPANTAITVRYASADSGDVAAMLSYIRAVCPDSFPLPRLAGIAAGSSVAVVGAALADYSMATLAILSPAFAGPYGLQEALLQAGKDAGAPFLAASQNSSAAYTSASEAAVAPQLPATSAWLDDWSGRAASFAGLSSPVYPVVRLDYLILPADLSPYGTSGGAVQGAAAFLAQRLAAPLLSMGLPVGFAELGPASVEAVSQRALPLTRLASGAAAWPLLDSSAPIENDDGSETYPSQGYVLTRTPSLLATVAAASSGGVSTQQLEALIAGYVQAANRDLASTVSDDHDKLSTTYGVAVAALVLTCVLSTLALLLAVVALVKSRSSKGGLLEPRSQQYVQHV